MSMVSKLYNQIASLWRELPFLKRRRSLDDENSTEISLPKRLKKNEDLVLDGNSHFTPQGRPPIRKRKIFEEVTQKMNQINQQNRLSKRDDVRQREAESHELFSESHAATSANSWKSPVPTSFSPRSYREKLRTNGLSPAPSSKELYEKKKYNELLVSIMKGSPSVETVPSSVPFCQVSNDSLVKNVSKTNDFFFCPWVKGSSSKKNKHSVTRRSDLNLSATVDLTKDEEESAEDISIEYEKVKNRTPRSNSLAAIMKAEPWIDPTFCKTQVDSWRKEVNKTCGRIKFEEDSMKVVHEINEKSNDKFISERLKKILQIKEAVIDEPEIEEIPQLPELTPEMEDKVIKAWSCRNPNQQLSEGFGLRITQRDLITLAQLNWLNDEVINFYMNLLMDRNKLKKYPKVYTFNTFFYPKLITGGHASLKRWTKKVDIFDHDLIAVPVHLGVHWCMSIIDFRKKTIDYYDSMGHSNQKCLCSLLEYLKEESLDKKKVPFDASGWSLNNVKNIPMQMNGSDCGMFACMFAEYISRGASISFSQENMPYFRKKVAYEILTRQLLEFK